MGRCLGNELRSLLASLAHVSNQDVGLCALSDILWHAAPPICTPEGNDMQVGHSDNPIAVPLDKVLADLLSSQERPGEPFGNDLDLSADFGDVPAANGVVFLSQWFAGVDQVDRSSLVKVLLDIHNKT